MALEGRSDSLSLRVERATVNHDPQSSATNRRCGVPYVIAEPCIGTKENLCIDVCPVDCIHPTPDEVDYDDAVQLHIDPEECIDCDACTEACPVDAIFAQDQLPDEWHRFVEVNSAYFGVRPGGGPRA